MSKLQRDLQHVVLLDMVDKDDYALRDLTNHTIFDYWFFVPVFSDFVLSQKVPDWQIKFLLRMPPYSSVCRLKWFKDLCHSFRSYIMRHFYYVERRDVLERYSLTYTKEVDFQRMFDL